MTKLVLSHRSFLIHGLICLDDEDSDGFFNTRYTCMVNIHGKMINIQALYTDKSFDTGLAVHASTISRYYENCSYDVKLEVHKHVRKYITTNVNNLNYCPNYITVMHNSFGITKNKILIKDIELREFEYHCKAPKQCLVPMTELSLNSSPPPTRQLLTA